MLNSYDYYCCAVTAIIIVLEKALTRYSCYSTWEVYISNQNNGLTLRQFCSQICHKVSVLKLTIS